MRDGSRRRVAVVGGGISGLTAAYLLRESHEVTLYEGADRLGGHAHTHDVDLGGGRTAPVDSGFIVHNHRTYPFLLRLLAELEVPTQRTEMSMSISCGGCGLEYAGGRGLSGILARPSRLADPRFVRMLLSVKRFHRRAAAHLASGGPDLTLGRWLEREGFDRYFVDHFAVPLVSCVWSAGQQAALEHPVRPLLTFLDHHGMLGVTGSPTWYTVTGGSREYVRRVAQRLHDVRLGQQVRQVRRRPGVGVTTDTGTDEFDHVILAVPADTALGLLADPSPAEQKALGSFTYTDNTVVLHRDERLLPRSARVRSSWNYRAGSCGARDERPVVSYWMNRLHDLPTAPPLVVTLNDVDDIPADLEVARMTYRHPVYTLAAVAAQEEVAALADDRTSFAGAHLGSGFHEDGCRSGVLAARRLGGAW